MPTIAAEPLSLLQLQLEETIADPAGYYARLLDAGPVFDPIAGAWLVSRHADVRAVLTNPASSVRMDHAGALARFPGAGLEETFAALDLHVSFIDGDQHRKLRRVLAEPVQVHTVRGRLAEPITAAATAAVNDLANHTVADMVTGFAARVPIDVTRHLLAIPSRIRTATIRRWSLAWGDVVAAPGHVPTTNRAATLAIVEELAGCRRCWLRRRCRCRGSRRGTRPGPSRR